MEKGAFFFNQKPGYILLSQCTSIRSVLPSKRNAYGHTTLVNARSRLISEAKQCRAWLVPGWETAWEYQVL